MMPNSQSKRALTFASLSNAQVFSHPNGPLQSLAALLCRQQNRRSLCGFSIFQHLDQATLAAERELVQTKIKSGDLTEEENRALGSFMGMPIGDALGAPVEFQDIRYDDAKIIKGMGSGRQGAFHLLPGQWTDDASMGLCLADSLLSCPEFDPTDLLLRFCCWWYTGYNNAFAEEVFREGSVGLGGIISQSLRRFMLTGESFTTAGDKYSSGNGSIMRLAAVPIFFHDNLEQAQTVASLQSLTTHQGEEAAALCALMTFIIIKAIRGSSSPAAAPIDVPSQAPDTQLLPVASSQAQDSQVTRAAEPETPLVDSTHTVAENLEVKKTSVSTPDLSSLPLYPPKRAVLSARDILDDLSAFKSDCPSVLLVAASKPEGDDPDRNWNWKDPNFRLSETRTRQQPGYMGSYAMDGLCLALHCIYHTSDFKSALLKCANHCGDADSTSSVCGQIAGAIYGVQAIPADWISAVQTWDRNGDIALRAWKLFYKGAECKISA